MKAKTYAVNFRCFFGAGRHNDHHQVIKLTDIPRWIEAYLFTHPGVQSISVKIWRDEDESGE